MFIGRLNRLTDEMEAAGRWAAIWKALGEVLPLAIGPTAVLLSVGISVYGPRGGARGGQEFLVRLLKANYVIEIISRNMTALQYSWQQYKKFETESKNIDAVLALPDAEPLSRTTDGTIKLAHASFGWPAKPPQTYEVTAATEPGESFAAQVGDTVEGVDEQKAGETVRVKSADGKEGNMKLSALKKLPSPKLEDWPAPAPAVADVDLEISQGELVLISGPVAAGKSSLLQSLVGNTEQLAGELAVPNSVAFQPQTPILFDQTIRANILFGISDEDANEEWMAKSLEASTLSMDMDDPDSTLHAKRELTGAGQNGSELSGGQQARVALARCIYASLAGSECVILDE